MIRKLLADRFQLQFHHNQRELTAFVLTVCKDGRKLKPAAERLAARHRRAGGGERLGCLRPVAQLAAAVAAPSKR